MTLEETWALCEVCRERSGAGAPPCERPGVQCPYKEKECRNVRS